MDINNTHNQSYWFVLREDQSNVIFSSNNFTIQNPPISGQETRYVVDSGDNRQYIQINEAQIAPEETTTEPCSKDSKIKDGDDFWDRDNVKLLLTLCLQSKTRNASKDKTMWDEIAVHVGTSPGECIKKYRNLRRTYIRLLKKKLTGKEIKWIHFNICEEVFKECKSLPASVLEPWEEHKVRRLLNLYLENINKFRNPEGLQKDVWRDIAFQLGTTEYNCYHKFKNLKRTYFNWLERSRQTGRVIKWPYHQYFERIFYNYSPSTGPWDRNKTRELLHAYTQLAHKFKNPRFQKKELWKEISASVGESPSSCDKKFRNLKQTYIRLKIQSESGRCMSKWRYYKDFEAITNLPYCSGGVASQTQTCYRTQDEDYVKQLLTFYIENKASFRDPLTRKKDIWRILGPKVNLSWEECDRKFRNLKQTYIRLVEKKRETGKCNKWPYYSYFEQIFDEQTAPRQSCRHDASADSLALSEIKRIMQEMHNKSDHDKFEKLVRAVEDSNKVQRERNIILQALLEKKYVVLNT